jgi:vacuolar-type H+-ATPase subunit H
MPWVSLILLAAAGAALAALYLKKRASDIALRAERTERERFEQEVSALRAQVRALDKYQGIVDVEAHAAGLRGEAERQAAELVAEARRTADALASEAARLRQAAETAAEAVRERARADAEDIKKRADAILAAASKETLAERNRAAAEAAELRKRSDAILADASAEAGRIIESASKRAQEVAGEAFAAMQNAKKLEQTASAMRNIIEGYGDRYVVPTQGVLDELAEQFGFAEAGVRKERIREEEKAQREFERAQREAEKEEELLRKAMEKARREFEKAGDEQKSKYEEQLNQLALRLQEAEEKNKRALSMAQQTKTGHVYVISNVGSFGDDVFKVGLTRRLEPLDRIKELGDASVPFDFDVHALIHSEDAPALERELHKRFVRSQVNKVNPRKEFFRVALQDIRQVVDGMGLQAQWTMTAEAREFRETQAVERAMQSQSFEEGAWLKHQLQAHDAALDAVREEAVG